MKSFERPRTGERAVLVRLGLGAPVDPEDLQEFTQLAVSAGAIPVFSLLAVQFPEIGKFLFSWLEPALQGLK